MLTRGRGEREIHLSIRQGQPQNNWMSHGRMSHARMASRVPVRNVRARVEGVYRSHHGLEIGILKRGEKEKGGTVLNKKKAGRGRI